MFAAWWLIIGVAEADDIRVTVEVTSEGLDVLAVGRGPAASRRTPRRQVPGGREDLWLDVRTRAGQVLTRVGIPDPRPRSIVLTGGRGAVVERQRGAITVDLPWPDGAAYFTDRTGRRWSPTGPVPRTPTPGSPSGVRLSGNGPSDERLDLVIVGDGYTLAELGDFADDAQEVVDHLRTIEPWTRYEGAFNIWRVDVASAASGAAPSEKEPIDTAFSCFYSCGGLDRLICCDDLAVTSTVEAAVPSSDGILVLVNSQEYGGSGGFSYATSYVGKEGLEVATHELGHSLAGLGDEYEYEEVAAQPYWYANCAPDSVGDWDEWLGFDEVDVFEGCGWNGYYRPREERCKMRNLDEAYCPVCLEQAVLEIHGALPRLVSSTVPSYSDPVIIGSERTTAAPTVITVETTLPVELLQFTWTLDGVELDVDGPVVELDCGSTGSELTLQVRDPTDWVRRELDVLEETVGPWQVVSTACDPPPVDTGEPGKDGSGACGCEGGLSTSALIGAVGLLGFRRRWPRDALRDGSRRSTGRRF